MHLPLARLISMSVIFCPLPSSSIVILVVYLFSTHISEQHVCELWVWIQITGLTLPLRESQWHLYHQHGPWVTFFAADSILCSSANFRTVFCESQNANPLDAEPETRFNAKWPFSVIQGHLFRCQWRAVGYIVQYNNCGLEYEGSENIASERNKNRHFRPPHSYLTSPLQRTPANIHVNLTLLEIRIPRLHFCRWQCVGSSANFRTVLSESQKRQLISCRARNRF